MMEIWSHDENRYVPILEVAYSLVRCPKCGQMVHKYFKTWYTGGMPCVILARQCEKCRAELQVNGRGIER